MAVYCIGDVQGCDEALQRLLEQVDFSPSRDTVYLLGDLVNRGPASVQVLRRCLAADGAILSLLGNHDLHLLAVAHGARKPSLRDTLAPVLQAHDRMTLLDWLRQQPLVRTLEHGGQSMLMVHAGVLPQWDVAQTLALGKEVQAVLCSRDLPLFLRQMYGNAPDHWSYQLQGIDRLRVVVNALTRLRFCSPAGAMDFASTESATVTPAGLLPWFEVPGRKTQGHLVAFGHWSTLGWLNRPDVLALDTGCVWGGCLSAVRFGATLAERELLQVRCPQAQKPG
ncbi:MULTISPECIES: symmetrical bis(5'-nucleosyl)-tetraphosphatase [Giesbergeria]|uniref:bis(5'-nucleosyl)-tetraphosphatase (symmetrical) n=1 Tax=Giesbergeria sinuosa TaxID=80883 RepID=A0ABV9QEN4_9BURK